MSKTNAFETDFLELVFNNTAITDIGDAGGLLPSSAAGDLYVALFTADPGETGTATNECTYGSYARVAVPRSGAGWTVTGNQVENAAEILFPEATSGTETATHFGICKGSTPTTADLILHGALTASLSITSSPAVTPRFAAGTLTVTED
jgi:hypothetical protein